MKSESNFALPHVSLSLQPRATGHLDQLYIDEKAETQQTEIRHICLDFRNIKYNFDVKNENKKA